MSGTFDLLSLSLSAKVNKFHNQVISISAVMQSRAQRMRTRGWRNGKKGWEKMNVGVVEDDEVKGRQLLVARRSKLIVQVSFP
jgi:hypothetical protein